jgi:mRNA interferase HigB
MWWQIAVEPLAAGGLVAPAEIAGSRFANYNSVEAVPVHRMRVISKSRLKRFWESPGCQDAEGPLRAWYTHVSSKTISWSNWSDVKRSFATASIVGNCTVFNIGGNKYRLIARILFPSRKVFVLAVLTHAEYDENRWPEACHCFDPPPKAPTKARGKSNGRQS